MLDFFLAMMPLGDLAFWRGPCREEVSCADVLRDASRLLGFSFLFLALAFRRFRLREEA